MATEYLSRQEVAATIIEERSGEIVQAAIEQSTALTAFRRVNVGTSTLRYTIINQLPTAQWLTAKTPDPDGDLDVKPVTDMGFDKVDVTVEELATMVVIPDNVVADSTVDLWGEVRSRCSEAIGKLIDQTIFFGSAPDGSGIPATFPTGGLVGEAVTAGNVVALDDSSGGAWMQSYSDFMSAVEDDGYTPSVVFAPPAFRGRLRTLTNAQGDPMLMSSFAQGTAVDPFGLNVSYITNGAWDPSAAVAITGEANLAWLIIREDLQVRMFDSGTVGDINLIQQDAQAMRIKMRLGFHVTTPTGIATPAGGYPFAVLTPAAGNGGEPEARRRAATKKTAPAS